MPHLNEQARRGKPSVIGRDEKSAACAGAFRLRKKSRAHRDLEGQTAMSKACAGCLRDCPSPEDSASSRSIWSHAAGAKYRANSKTAESRPERNRRFARQDILSSTSCTPWSAAARRRRDRLNMLKPALARGELRAIGATTLNEYRKYIEKDARSNAAFRSCSWASRMSKTHRHPPRLKEKYEVHHGSASRLCHCCQRLFRIATFDRFCPTKRST